MSAFAAKKSFIRKELNTSMASQLQCSETPAIASDISIDVLLHKCIFVYLDNTTTGRMHSV